MGKFSELFQAANEAADFPSKPSPGGGVMHSKRTFKIHAKDHEGKDYHYDHESYSPRHIHQSDRFEPATPGGGGGLGHKLVSIKHNGKDVTNESVLDEASLRKVGEHENGNKKATVHRDTEWGEYRVKLHVDGKHQSKSDYHTDDADDAHGTARHMVGLVSKSAKSE